MTIIEQILNILNEQINGYKLLLDLLQKERECLLDLNVEGVEDIVKEKDTILLRLRLLEAERIRLTKIFSKDDITLRGLYEITGDASFIETRSKLISLLQSVEELNKFNRLLIERSLNYISGAINLFNFFDIGTNIGKGARLSLEM